MEDRITPAAKPATLPQEFEHFLHYWTTMDSGTQFSIDRLYHTVEERLQSRTAGASIDWSRSLPCAEATLSFFREIIGYSPAYTAIRWPQSALTDGETAVAAAIGRLTGDLNMKSSAHPLLLALMGKYLRSTPRDVTGFLDCIRILESYLIRRVICDVATNQHNRIAMQIAHEIYSQRELTLPDSASWMRANLRVRPSDDRWPDDAEFERAFVDASFERQGAKRKFAKALLIEIDRRRPGSVALDPAGLTIEHIMPEELTADWRTHLGQHCDNVHRDCLHRFGNLTILEPNLNRGTALLEAKKADYARSQSVLTRELGNLGDEWGETQVLQRGHDLFQLVREAWPRPA
jgi:hypothetical protein